VLKTDPVDEGTIVLGHDAGKAEILPGNSDFIQRITL